MCKKDVFLLVTAVLLLFPHKQLGAQDAAALIKRGNDRMDQATEAYSKTGDIERFAADLVQAEADLMAGFRATPDPGKSPDAIWALNRAAKCLRIMKRLPEARDRYNQAIQLAQQAHHTEYEAKAWYGLELTERERLDHGKAADALEQAIRLAHSAKGLEALEVDLLGERGDLQLEDGEIDKAISSLNEAVQRGRTLADKFVLATSLIRRANASQVRLSEQIPLYSKLPYVTPRDWEHCQAVEKQIRDDLKDGMQGSEEALHLYEALGVGASVAILKNQISAYTMQTSAFNDTVAILKKAHDEGRTPKLEEQDRIELVELPVIGLLDPVAEKQQLDEIAALRKIMIDGPVPLAASWRQHLNRGMLLEQENKLREATVEYRLAVDLIERERRTFPSDQARAAFAADKIDVFDRLILTLLARHDQAEAFHWMEQSRSRALAEQLALSDLHFQSAKDRSLYAELVAMRSRVRSAGASVPGNLQASYDELMERIRRESPGLLELADAQPASLEDLRSAMRKKPFDIVYYLLDQGRLILWHIGPQSIHLKAYLAPPNDLQRFVLDLREDLAKDPGSTKFNCDSACSLYDYLAKPMEHWLETNHLVAVVPPMLQGLPLSSLRDERHGKFLDETLAVSYVPSASILLRLQPAHKLEGSKTLVLVGPDLKFGPTDAASIRKKYPDTTVVPARSGTWSTLKREAGGKNVIHLAAHGMYDATDPMRSFISLRPEDGFDGHVTAAQMSELPLRGTTLVTLGSCEAGKVDADNGNELFGIMRALLYAGAQSLLLPLWKANAEAASRWTAAFYKEALVKPLPEAARLANVELRKLPKFAHPHYWAAFALIGY